MLGRDYQFLVRRGKPASVSSPLPAANGQTTAPPATPTPLIKTQIYKPTPQSPINSVIDSFAADGVMTKVADEGASHIPDIFRSVVGGPSTPAPGVVAVSAQGKGGVGLGDVRTLVGRYVSLPSGGGSEAWWVKGGKEWWYRDRLDKIVEGLLPNRYLDALAIECTSPCFPPAFFHTDQRNTSTIPPRMCVPNRRPLWCSPEGYTTRIGSVLVVPRGCRGLSS